MSKAKILLDQRLDISERYRAEMRVFKVDPSQKHPTGIRVRFVLIDVVAKSARLLIDNHEPYGFHVHEDLPNNKHSRRLLKTKSYQEALDEFWHLSKEIIYGKN